MALPIAYGSRTMLKAAYYLSEEYNLFLNKDNLFFFRYLVVVSFAIYSLCLILIGYYKSNKINLDTGFDKDFIIGASIFVGTYIIGSNADYRLIFLLFTIPLILNLKNRTIQISLLLSIFLSFNILTAKRVAKNVFPVPAGPKAKVRSLFSIAST